jgi:hypothetical protein
MRALIFLYYALQIGSFVVALVYAATQNTNMEDKEQGGRRGGWECFRGAGELTRTYFVSRKRAHGRWLFTNYSK